MYCEGVCVQIVVYDPKSQFSSLMVHGRAGIWASLYFRWRAACHFVIMAIGIVLFSPLGVLP